MVLMRDDETEPTPDSMEARVARLEAILRAHRMHEEDCPVGRVQEHIAGGTYMLPQGCECWLRDWV